MSSHVLCPVYLACRRPGFLYCNRMRSTRPFCPVVAGKSHPPGTGMRKPFQGNPFSTPRCSSDYTVLYIIVEISLIPRGYDQIPCAASQPSALLSPRIQAVEQPCIHGRAWPPGTLFLSRKMYKFTYWLHDVVTKMYLRFER